jgi:hypothetical protein
MAAGQWIAMQLREVGKLAVYLWKIRWLYELCVSVHLFSLAFLKPACSCPTLLLPCTLLDPSGGTRRRRFALRDAMLG